MAEERILPRGRGVRWLGLRGMVVGIVHRLPEVTNGLPQRGAELANPGWPKHQQGEDQADDKLFINVHLSPSLL